MKESCNPGEVIEGNKMRGEIAGVLGPLVCHFILGRAWDTV